MKKFIVLSLVLASSCCQSSSVFAALRLVKVGGDITAKSGEKFLTPTVGAVFYDGTIIRTGSRGSAVLLHPEGHAVRVWPLSVVTLNTNELSGKAPKVTLKEGKVFIQAMKVLKNKEIFQVETSDVLAGVRGTSFSVERLPGSGSQVDVLEGTVYIRSQGVERLVEAGFSSLILPGAPPPQPTPMKRERFDSLKEGARESEGIRQDGTRDGSLRGSLPDGLNKETMGRAPAVVREMVLQNDGLSVDQKLDIIRELSTTLVTEQIREDLIQKLEQFQGSATFVVD